MTCLLLLFFLVTAKNAFSADGLHFATHEPSACSPPLPQNTGIAITIPPEIKMSAIDSIPLCISWRVASKKGERPSVSVTDMKHFTFRLVTPEKEHAGPLRENDPKTCIEYAQDGKPEVEDDSQNDGPQSIGGWVNLNLVHSWTFPEREANYLLSISTKDLKSNQVSFKVVRDPAFRPTHDTTILRPGTDTYVGDTYLAWRHKGLGVFGEEGILSKKSGEEKNPGVQLELVNQKTKERENLLLVWPGEEKRWNHLEFTIDRIGPGGEAYVTWKYLHVETYLKQHPKRKDK